MERDTDWPDAAIYLLPGPEVLFAAVLALMTGHAQGACERQRAAMTHKIRTLLFALGHQTCLSLPMRTMVGCLHAHWQALTSEPALRVHSPAPAPGSPTHY